jgi:hypothetical protein
MNTDAYKIFQKSVEIIDQNLVLHKFLIENYHSLDLSDNLRFQIAQIVSAMDKYFHDLIIELVSNLSGKSFQKKYSHFMT